MLLLLVPCLVWSVEIQHQHKVTHCSSAADNISRVLEDITNCTIVNKSQSSIYSLFSNVEKEFDADSYF